MKVGVVNMSKFTVGSNDVKNVRALVQGYTYKKKLLRGFNLDLLRSTGNCTRYLIITYNRI